MKNIFKTYKFKIEENYTNESLIAYHRIKIYHKIIYGESILSSIKGGGDFSLYLQNRFFNFTIDNETKRICAFDGNLSYSNVKFVKVQFPNKIIDSILKLNTQEDLPAGCGSYIEFNANKILYDKSQQILQIGDIDNNEITYKFFSNAYAQINQDKITGLIFTEIDL